jgi:peptidoglycan/xylan/chitin deacetylase (PgdA/CDA1 family)
VPALAAAPPPQVVVVRARTDSVTVRLVVRQHQVVRVRAELFDAAGRLRRIRRVRVAAPSTRTLVLRGVALHSGEYRVRVRMITAHHVVRFASSGWVATRLPGRVRIVRSFPAAGHEAALTFDDGVDHAASLRVLDTLGATATPATLFVNGVNYARAPALVERVRRLLARDVVTLGNHTYDHPRLTRIGADAARAEITRDEQFDERLFGRSSLPYLRPPYGAHDATVRAVAGALGYTTFLLWSVDPADYLLPPAATVIARVERQLSPGAVILMHLDRSTAAALPGVIAALHRRRYRIVPIARLVVDGAAPGAGPG